MTIRFLCIFAIPRTGSSHVNKLIKSCPDFAAKSELFHRRSLGNHKKFEFLALKEASGGVVVDGESFLNWRREHPAQTLEALHAAWETKTIAFKIFPSHLALELIESEFLQRKDIVFGVLRRRPIESFISGVKAKGEGIFGRTDTTAVKPEISSEGFLQWARRTRKWYGWVEEVLQARGEPFAEISFEKHLDGLSGPEAFGHIRDLLRPLGITNFDASAEILEGTRQDKEPDYKNRVANWDAFEAALRSNRQHEKMLNWAERSP